jgi:hypothetical protein
MASVAAASGQATAGGWRTPERFVAWQLVAFISEAMSAHDVVDGARSRQRAPIG